MCPFPPTNSSTFKTVSEIQSEEAEKENVLGKQRIESSRAAKTGLHGGTLTQTLEKKRRGKIKFTTSK